MLVAFCIFFKFVISARSTKGYAITHLYYSKGRLALLLANLLPYVWHNENNMKNNLTLEVDKKKAKEGEFVEIRWECTSCPDSLLLILDSGYKSDKLVVSDSGSTKIATPKCKRKFQISLVATVSGKKVTKETSIHVLNVRSGKEKAASKVGKWKLSREKAYASWCVFRAQTKYWWLSQKKWKKALWIILLILWFGLLLFSILGNHITAAAGSQTAYLINNL